MGKSVEHAPEPARPSPQRERSAATDVERLVRELGPEPARCLVCRTPAPRKLFFRTNKWFWICAACELVFVHDIYPEFVEDVAHLDGTYEFHSTRQAKPRELREYRGLLAAFERVRGAGRLLEVGCGHGRFLEAARHARWQVQGVELISEVAAIARTERGLDVHTGEIFDAHFPADHFDAVYMNEVIEHVIDPVALLREVHRVLIPGGLALLRTGNARSWSARWRGGEWHYYRFGGHLHIRFFGPKSADALGRASGFARTRTRTRGFAFRESRELSGRLYKPLVQSAQALVSPFAAPFHMGHRLTMLFHKDA